MVGRRRGIHSESHGEEEENKQVFRTCYRCNNVIFDENNIEHEQLEKECGINNESRGRKLYPDLSAEHILCGDCDNKRNEKDSYRLPRTFSDLHFKLYMVLAVLFVVGIIVWVNVTFNRNSPTEKPFDVNMLNQTQDEIDFDDELYGLENTYKQQEERVWYTFAAGIKSVLAENPNKPSVFLMFYEDGAKNTAKCIAHDVTKVATKYLMKKETEPLVVEGAKLNDEYIMHDPGRLLVMYKDQVESNGAMIVTNLEDVQPKIAASFHFFCDRYSPLVEKAIYFFTIKLKQVPKVPLQKVAEDTLHGLWAKDLPDNKLDPLITRMTGNVLRISNDLSNC